MRLSLRVNFKKKLFAFFNFLLTFFGTGAIIGRYGSITAKSILCITFDQCVSFFLLWDSYFIIITFILIKERFFLDTFRKNREM